MSQIKTSRPPLSILFVEDNLAHVELMRRSFAQHQSLGTIHHVQDGQSALDFLFRRDRFAGPSPPPHPNVVLLDLRLPKIDGLEVLKEIRASDQFRRLPVVVLSTSDAPSDVAQAYEQQANSYLVKPIDFSQFLQLMADLSAYWLGWNYYPWSRPRL